MADTKTTVANAPIWLDLSSSDAAASRDYYSKVFGWKIEVNPDPQYGGYGVAKLNGKDVAGIGPKMDPNGPSAWLIYVGTSDADEAVKKITGAGGKVIAPPMQVGPQGRMVVIQDPTGAFLGLSLGGGLRFNVLGSYLGVLLLAMVTTGLTMMNAPSWVAALVQGIVLIVAVAGVAVRRRGALGR